MADKEDEGVGDAVTEPLAVALPCALEEPLALPSAEGESEEVPETLVDSEALPDEERERAGDRDEEFEALAEGEMLDSEVPEGLTDPAGEAEGPTEADLSLEYVLSPLGVLLSEALRHKEGDAERELTGSGESVALPVSEGDAVLLALGATNAFDAEVEGEGTQSLGDALAERVELPLADAGALDDALVLKESEALDDPEADATALLLPDADRVTERETLGLGVWLTEEVVRGEDELLRVPSADALGLLDVLLLPESERRLLGDLVGSGDDVGT